MARPKDKQPDRERRAPRRKSGSLFAMFFMLVILSGLTVFGIMMGKRQQVRETPVAEEPAPPDPFAGMTYSEDDVGKKAVSSFGSVADFESEAELWLRARDTYAEAQALIDQSSIQRAAGDATWRVLSVEAKGLVEEAVQRGEVWRGVLVKEGGESSNDVARLDKTLQKWRRTQMILHKTVGP